MESESKCDGVPTGEESYGFELAPVSDAINHRQVTGSEIDPSPRKASTQCPIVESKLNPTFSHEFNQASRCRADVQSLDIAQHMEDSTMTS